MRLLLLICLLWLSTMFLIHILPFNNPFPLPLHATLLQNHSHPHFSKLTYSKPTSFSITQQKHAEEPAKYNHHILCPPQFSQEEYAPSVAKPPNIHSTFLLPFTHLCTKFSSQNSCVSSSITPKILHFTYTNFNHKISQKLPNLSLNHKENLSSFISPSHTQNTTQKTQVFSFCTFSNNGSFTKKNILFKKSRWNKWLKKPITTTQLCVTPLPHKSFFSKMNSYYDSPPGFASRRSPAPSSRITTSLPSRPQDLSRLDASLILRTNYKIRTSYLRVSNCPMKAKDIHRLWMYIHKDLGYKVGTLPFAADDPLSDNAFDWAHPDSTTKRPVLISDAIHENSMQFHSAVMTISGRTHPGWESDPSVSASFPMYSEHRINLSAFVTNLKTKRLEPQTRLIQIQPTMIPPTSEPYWTPLLILSGLGSNYSNSKCCVTGAVLAHLYGFIYSFNEDFGERFTRSVQIDWSFFQFTVPGGNQRTQPVAVLKICKNDPDDQSESATLFSKKIGNLILGHIFESNPAAHTPFDFCGFAIRVHRVDRAGTLQPLSDILRKDLILPAPSDVLYKIILQNLSPFPSLPLIHQRIRETGILDIENIAYVQIETNRAPRHNRLDWMNQFQVALFLKSVGSAQALLHPHNQNHISQCLASVLEDSMVPLILIPPSNLPPISPERLTPLRFPISSITQQILQRLYQTLPINAVQQQYLHPPPSPIPQSRTSVTDSSSAPSRNQSPKRSRQPHSSEEGPSQPLEPTDNDIAIFNEVSERLMFLYKRLPSDTYSFVSNTLDQLRDQLSQDGLLDDGETSAETSQDPPFSSASSNHFHHGSSRPGQSSISSSPSELQLGFSPTQSDTPSR